MNSNNLFPESWKVIVHSRTVWFWVLLSSGNILISIQEVIISSEEIMPSNIFSALLLCNLSLFLFMANFISGVGLIVTVCEIEQGRSPRIAGSWRFTKQVFWRVLGMNVVAGLLTLVFVGPLSFLATFFLPIAPSDLQFLTWLYVAIYSWAAMFSAISIYATLFIIFERGTMFSSIGSSIRLIARNTLAVVGLSLLVLAVRLLPIFGPGYLAMLFKGYSLGEWPIFQIYILAMGKSIYQFYNAVFSLIFLPFHWSIFTIAFMSFTGKEVAEFAPVDAAV